MALVDAVAAGAARQPRPAFFSPVVDFLCLGGGSLLLLPVLLWVIPDTLNGQTLVFAGPGTKGMTAVKLGKVGNELKEEQLWEYSGNVLIYNTPVLKDGFLYGLSSGGNLFCINAKTGETAWTDSANRMQYGAMVDVGPAILARSRFSATTSGKAVTAATRPLLVRSSA